MGLVRYGPWQETLDLTTLSACAEKYFVGGILFFSIASEEFHFYALVEKSDEYVLCMPALPAAFTIS